MLRAAKMDWADLEAAWPEDEYEELQQRAEEGHRLLTAEALVRRLVALLPPARLHLRR